MIEDFESHIPDSSSERNNITLDYTHAAEILRESADIAKIPELNDIATQLAEGINDTTAAAGLDIAINEIAKIDLRNMVEAKPELHEVIAQVDRVYFWLIPERVQRTSKAMVQTDAETILNTSASMGDTPAMRIELARRSQEHISEARPGDVQTAEEQIVRRDFGPDGASDFSVFESGFTPEGQRALSRQLIEIASLNTRGASKENPLPDTVAAVIGNHPEVVQLLLGFTRGEVVDRGTAIDMSFSGLAQKAKIVIPDEILAKLQLAS
jgi:hypothetical protein